jgi:hypothetical protein
MAISETNTNTDVYKTIYTLINTNKISGSYVYSGFSEKTIAFPCYIINPALVSVRKADYQGASQDYDISIEIELWATGNQLKAKIDEMKGNIRATVLNNLASLRTSGLDLAEEWYDDSNVDTLEMEQVKYHTGAVILSFKLD